MEAKVSLLGPLVAVAPSHAIFASNTSSLSITELGQKIGAAERTIGTHFFNPAPMMDLVEVVKGMAGSEETLQATLALVGTLKKTPIVIRDVPGFATSRLGVLLGAEAMRMVESGGYRYGDGARIPTPDGPIEVDRRRWTRCTP
jgi:3-hydroxybutyryl-CoA dehydrogenase